MISPKTKRIYDFIVSYAIDNGIAPSLEEIAEHFSDFLTYPSSAYYHVKRLQQAGYLVRETNKPRSIGIYPDKTLKTPLMTDKGLDSISIPIMGSANAGPATLFAEENLMGYLKVSRSKLRKKERVFALRVEGDSMNMAKINGKNIEDGDFVVIDPDKRTPENDDYVLSVIDGCANIKKFSRDIQTGNIMLLSESDNDKYKPIFLSSKDDFMINGMIIDVIKK